MSQSSRCHFQVATAANLRLPLSAEMASTAVLNALQMIVPQYGCMVVGDLIFNFIILCFFYAGGKLRMLILSLDNLRIYDAFAFQQDVLHVLHSCQDFIWLPKNLEVDWTEFTSEKPGWKFFHIKSKDAFQSLQCCLSSSVIQLRQNCALRLWLSQTTHQFLTDGKVTRVPDSYRKLEPRHRNLLGTQPLSSNITEGKDCQDKDCFCHKAKAAFDAHLRSQEVGPSEAKEETKDPREPRLVFVPDAPMKVKASSLLGFVPTAVHTEISLWFLSFTRLVHQALERQEAEGDPYDEEYMRSSLDPKLVQKYRRCLNGADVKRVVRKARGKDKAKKKKKKKKKKRESSSKTEVVVITRRKGDGGRSAFPVRPGFEQAPVRGDVDDEDEDVDDTESDGDVTEEPPRKKKKKAHEAEEVDKPKPKPKTKTEPRKRTGSIYTWLKGLAQAQKE